jgi:hypothetical protein
MEMVFEKTGTPDMTAYVNKLPSGQYSLTEASGEGNTAGPTIRKVLFDVSYAEIGQWLVKNEYYLQIYGCRIYISAHNWDNSAEAERVRREFIGYTLRDGEIVPVLWDDFRKEIGPLEIGQAKESLIRYISEATGEHRLRVIFEMYGKLGKLI